MYLKLTATITVVTTYLSFRPSSPTVSSHVDPWIGYGRYARAQRDVVFAVRIFNPTKTNPGTLLSSVSSTKHAIIANNRPILHYFPYYFVVKSQKSKITRWMWIWLPSATIDLILASLDLFLYNSSVFQPATLKQIPIPDSGWGTVYYLSVPSCTTPRSHRHSLNQHRRNRHQIRPLG